MKEAGRLVKIKRGDTVEMITKFEAIVRRMLQLGMEGDIAAARLVFFGLAQNAPDGPMGRRRTRPQTPPLASRRTTRLCAGWWGASRICSRRKRRPRQGSSLCQARFSTSNSKGRIAVGPTLNSAAAPLPGSPDAIRLDADGRR
jgi:hypothetical protein